MHVTMEMRKEIMMCDREWERIKKYLWYRIFCHKVERYDRQG
jgi:phage anti-repressor protein